MYLSPKNQAPNNTIRRTKCTTKWQAAFRVKYFKVAVIRWKWLGGEGGGGGGRRFGVTGGGASPKQCSNALFFFLFFFFLRSPAISLGFITFLGEIFAYVTVF